ncbi:MAG TPA: hypothetical protein DDW78_06055 [Treponema sp.]|nr:hypothetical protein [Treponema sp.]
MGAASKQKNTLPAGVVSDSGGRRLPCKRRSRRKSSPPVSKAFPLQTKKCAPGGKPPGTAGCIAARYKGGAGRFFASAHFFMLNLSARPASKTIARRQEAAL